MEHLSPPSFCKIFQIKISEFKENFKNMYCYHAKNTYQLVYQRYNVHILGISSIAWMLFNCMVDEGDPISFFFSGCVECLPWVIQSLQNYLAWPCQNSCR